MKQLFYGGVHPAEHKEATEQKPIQPLAKAPAQVVIPMSMHIGAPCKPTVQKGDTVLVGQMIGATAGLGAPIHASVSGTVVAVEPRPGTGGVPTLSVVIENDFQNTLSPDCKPRENVDALSSQEIIDIIRDAGCTGMGGAGFPTGLKWKLCKQNDADQKYVCCNADEGDPGAFMDRSVMEGNPHSVLEGMMIAGLAVGSDEGYIYVRAEYPLAVNRLKTAIARAEEMGLLGTNILGSDFNFRIHVNKGAGAFVCGEGSALTASIEGNRGMPRVKPPRTIEHGLWAEPTVLNNVETFANVPLIIKNGVEWYHSIGTEKSPGTKAFALTGNVVNTGLIEVPMGTTIREVVFDIGGGIPNGKKFKAVQIGGPSGGATTASDEHLDLPLDFDSLKSIGAMIGSGGLVVMDEDTCMVETARFFMRFTQNESCGKCVPCREGTKRMLEILDRIIANEGSLEDLDLLQELSKTISETALCGLGQSACKPVQSTLRHFRQDYLRHVVDHHCPICNGRKRRLVIKPELCKGCGKCKRNCPMEAISGEIRMPHTIDNDKCIHCGACWGACPFGAIDAIEEED